MSSMERIYQIDQILGVRHSVTRKELQERLCVSWATLKRDIAYMRDRLNAPLIFDRTLCGYRFEKTGQRIGPQYELPGLWFTAEEIHALLTMQHLLSNLDTGGLLGPQIQPLLARSLACSAQPTTRPRKCNAAYAFRPSAPVNSTSTTSRPSAPPCSAASAS